MKGRDAANGSQVTVTAEGGALNDYLSYRSGERFYVVIPGADAESVGGVAGGRGFEEAQVEKRGQDVVLSFKLQPGASAAVRQRGNRLDVQFNARGDAAAAASSTSGTNAGASSATQLSAERVVSQSAEAANPPSRNPAAGASASQATETQSVKPADNLFAIGTPPPSSAGVSAPDASALPAEAVPGSLGQPTSAPPAAIDLAPAQQPTPIAPSANPAGQGTSASSASSAVAFVARAWPWAAGVVFLCLTGLFLLMRQRRRTSAEGRNSGEGTSGLLSGDTARRPPPSPSAPLAEAADSLGGAKKREPKIAPPGRTARGPEATPFVEARSTEAPPAAAVETAVPAQASEVEREIESLLFGNSVREEFVNVRDAATRRHISARLLGAMEGRSVVQRANARTAFIKYGYFADALSELQTAGSPAVRARAARAIASVRDKSATPFLVGALADEAPEVQSAVVEALAQLKDPRAAGPLRLLRETAPELPQTLIQEALEACDVNVVDETASRANLDAALARSARVKAAAAERDAQPRPSTAAPRIETPAAAPDFPSASPQPAIIASDLPQGIEAAPVNDLESVPTRSLEENGSGNESVSEERPSEEASHHAAFAKICARFEDERAEARHAAARDLYHFDADPVGAFTRAIQEAGAERRLRIGQSIAASGLAAEAIDNLNGGKRDKSFEAFSLLFLMAKTGEIETLTRVVETHQDDELRLSVIKLLALSARPEALLALRRLATGPGLPNKVREALLEAVYQLTHQTTQGRQSDG